MGVDVYGEVNERLQEPLDSGPRQWLGLQALLIDSSGRLEITQDLTHLVETCPDNGRVQTTRRHDASVIRLRRRRWAVSRNSPKAAIWAFAHAPSRSS